MPDRLAARLRVRHSDGLYRAHSTLVRGARFIARQPLPDGRSGTDLLPDRVRARMVGNRLRELDRFLGVLAEEVALCVGAHDHDPADFARLHNSANKLRAVRGWMRLASPDHERLRAVGRVRACLHHCGGRIHNPAMRRALSPATVLFGLGERAGGDGRIMLALSAEAMARICGLYRDTADALVAEIERGAIDATPIDFPPRLPHIDHANVACDGI